MRVACNFQGGKPGIDQYLGSQYKFIPQSYFNSPFKQIYHHTYVEATQRK